jgi:hypothetical protein
VKQLAGFYRENRLYFDKPEHVLIGFSMRESAASATGHWAVAFTGSLITGKVTGGVLDGNL